MKWVPCVLKPLIPKYYCVFKQNNDGHLAKMPMFREGHRDRQCLRDGQVNAFQLALTEGHALAGGTAGTPLNYLNSLFFSSKHMTMN